MIRERLGEILFFFRSNFLALLLVALPFALAAAVIARVLGEPVTLVEEKPVLHWESALGLTLLYPLALGAKVMAVHQLATEGRLMAGPLVAGVLRAWPALLVVSIVVGTAVGFGVVFLFVIPGAWFYARLGYAPLLATLDGLRGGEAVAEAWRRSREQQGELFLFTLLFGLLLVGVMVLVFHLVGVADASATLGADIVARTVNELLLFLLTIGFYRYWSLGTRAP